MLQATPQGLGPRLVGAAAAYKAAELRDPAHRLGKRGWLFRRRVAYPGAADNVSGPLPLVAYLGAADNVSRLLPIWLRGINQLVLRTRNPLARPHLARLACICGLLSGSTLRSSPGTVA